MMDNDGESRPGIQRRRALITGGLGFIGSHLAESLLERGYEVTALDDASTGRIENVQHLLPHEDYRVVMGSVTDSALMETLVAASDVVFHLAAAVGVRLVLDDPLGGLETNITGTEVVLQAAARHRTKVLVASTSEVYGKCVRVPASEDDDVLLGASRYSRWSYAAAKMVDEFLALAYHKQKDVPVVVFRLFNTVGPRQTGRYGMVIPRFVQSALGGRPIPVHGDGQQSRAFLHVRDAVEGIVRLSESDEALGELFNIGASDEITIIDLARKVLDKTAPLAPAGARAEMTAELTLVPYEEAMPAGFEDIRRRVADTTKLRRFTGWAPQNTLDDILDDVIAEHTVGIQQAELEQAS
jgi:UDP-glucose 4-epimerase